MRVSQWPFRIGRAAAADLRLEEPGVWEQHLELDLAGGDGFTLTRLGQALALVNGSAVERCLLRNGDLIEIGALRMQFWLADVAQRGARWREWMVWILVGLVCALQVLLATLLDG